MTPIQTRIRMPGQYHRQPVISRLVSRYNLTVNIVAASLQLGDENEGWFDIQLSGNSEQLVSSLSYLEKLGVDLLQLVITDQIKSNQNYQILNSSIDKLENTSYPHTSLNEKIVKPSDVVELVSQEHHKSLLLAKQLEIQVESKIANAQTNRVRLQLCIFNTYQQKPIISELISHYGLTVNITSAMLNFNTEDDGWFDLELWGRPQQISSSLVYLENLGLPLWINSYYD